MEVFTKEDHTMEHYLHTPLVDDQWDLEMTSTVEDMIEKGPKGLKGMRIGDLRELKFELGGSPFDYGISTHHGRLYWSNRDTVNEYSDGKIHEFDNDVEFLIDIGNCLSGGHLIDWLSKTRWNNGFDNKTFISLDMILILMDLYWGDIPSIVWTSGDEYNVNGCLNEEEN